MTMLTKLFGASKIKPPSSFLSPATASPAVQSAADDRQRPLRIIHAGGSVECYYMAVPAAGIIEKYPGSVLARPDVFHRPWEPLVRPEEILTPGEKFYLVPRGTVKKLRRRIRRPSSRCLGAVGESTGVSETDLSVKSLVPNVREAKTYMKKSYGNGQATKGNAMGKPVSQVRPPRRKKVRFEDAWQPSLGSSLGSIDESSPVMEFPLDQECTVSKNG